MRNNKISEFLEDKIGEINKIKQSMFETIKYSVNHQQITYKEAIEYLTKYNIFNYADYVFGPDWIKDIAYTYYNEVLYQPRSYFELALLINEDRFEELYKFIIENQTIGFIIH